MVDVSPKNVSLRKAVARAKIKIPSSLTSYLLQQKNKQNSLLEAPKIAGIMAAKKTSELIPLCHNITLDNVTLDITLQDQKNELSFESTVQTNSKTGAEMEALTSVAIAAVTFYDMVKSKYPGLIIESCGVYYKSGGKSGEYINQTLDQ